MLRFTIRDVLWLTALVAMGCAWWAERREADKARELDWNVHRLTELIQEEGYFVRIDKRGIGIREERPGGRSRGVRRDEN